MQLRVGLIDVDSRNFPNLVLMKLSAYHKKRGDIVEFYNPFFEYDIVYKSKIFTFTKDYKYNINAKEVIIGGTGYNLESKLSDEIEHIYPDYSLYNESRAIGFLTRGCPRSCDFCIVSKKEGRKSVKVADLQEFWNGQNVIYIMDSNLLACKERVDLLKQLKESEAYINFNQGLDIRLMDDEIIYYLNNMKVERVHFAWDKAEQEELILKNLREFKEKTNFKDVSLTIVYVLTNFDTTFEYDLYRVYKLRELGYNPYIMVYEKEKADIKYKRLQRWVNHRKFFHSIKSFEDFLKYIETNSYIIEGKEEKFLW